MKHFELVFLFALVAALTACQRDSGDLRTSELTAVYLATEADNVTSVEASFSAGSGFQSRDVVLSSGDTVSATMDGQEKTLIRSGDKYSAQFDSSAAGSDVSFALLRQRYANAPASLVALPEPLAFSAPAAGETFNNDESVSIVWTPGMASATIGIYFALSCPEDSAATVRVFNLDTPDTGSVTVSVAEIVAGKNDTPYPSPGVACSVEISMGRTSYGIMDDNLSGSITAVSEAQVSVNMVP